MGIRKWRVKIGGCLRIILANHSQLSERVCEAAERRTDAAFHSLRAHIDTGNMYPQGAKRLQLLAFGEVAP
jgi:hypothetical protein